MGQKITIDSASMMNKGLELIEAHHLFALSPDEIDVLVHPQSIVHGLVEFPDGSVMAQLGAPDMRIPIAHCLAWPDRIDGPRRRARSRQDRPADLRGAGPRRVSRRCGWRYDALRTGRGAPTVFNAANEVAVAAFLAGTDRLRRHRAAGRGDAERLDRAPAIWRR